MKRILLIISLFLIVFLIYYFNIDKEIYYVSLGDYLSYGIDNFKNTNYGYSNYIKDNYKDNLKNYVNYSTTDDYRVTDLISDINYNKEITFNNKKYKIQNLLIKANLITISIGMNDLIYSKTLTYDYIDGLLVNIEELFKLIRKYNKDEIYFLSFYNIINNSKLIDYTNKRLVGICNDYKIKYVDISILDTYFINNYPTKDGYLYIKDKIINFTK